MTTVSLLLPALTNASSTSTTEFTVDNATQTYEEFDWSKSGYDGLSLATTYTLEASKTDDFASPKTLATTTTNSASVTKGQLNDALLAMGVPGFVETTVNFRVKSVITGQNNAALVSPVVSRKVKTFQASDCGKYCTVGIIGAASPGGWDVDVDMHLKDATRVDRSTWTITLYLAAGDVKFRAQDGWDINWGAASFPTGTGLQNGANHHRSNRRLL
ncbi:MAG: SusE domain-containing protein [Bacteroidota bacterium]